MCCTCFYMRRARIAAMDPAMRNPAIAQQGPQLQRIGRAQRAIELVHRSLRLTLPGYPAGQYWHYQCQYCRAMCQRRLTATSLKAPAASARHPGLAPAPRSDAGWHIRQTCGSVRASRAAACGPAGNCWRSAPQVPPARPRARRADPCADADVVLA